MKSECVGQDWHLLTDCLQPGSVINGKSTTSKVGKHLVLDCGITQTHTKLVLKDSGYRWYSAHHGRVTTSRNNVTCTLLHSEKRLQIRNIQSLKFPESEPRSTVRELLLSSSTLEAVSSEREFFQLTSTRSTCSCLPCCGGARPGQCRTRPTAVACTR